MSQRQSQLTASISNRSVEDIFNDHLQLALDGDLETDIARNFAEDCVLLTTYGVFRGHAGIREAAELLMRQLPNARYRYRRRLCDGEIAFLEWEADADGAQVDDGADSFLIRNGAIQAMTIHYTVRAK